MNKPQISGRKTQRISHLKKLLAGSIMLLMMCSPLNAYAAEETIKNPLGSIFISRINVTALQNQQKNNSEKKDPAPVVKLINSGKKLIHDLIDAKSGYVKADKNNGFTILEKTRLPLNTNVMYAIKLDNPLKSSELKFKKLDLGNILSFSASSGGLSLNHDLGFSKGYIKLGTRNKEITGLTISGQSKLPFLNKEIAIGAKID